MKRARGRQQTNTFSLPPEILPHIFAYLKTSTLLRLRQVSKTWNFEICRCLSVEKDRSLDVDTVWEKRRDFEPWSATGPKPPNEFASILIRSANPELFFNCTMSSSRQFLTSSNILMTHGPHLTRLGVLLDEYVASKETFQLLNKVVGELCPNLKYLKLSAMMDWAQPEFTPGAESVGIEELELQFKFLRNATPFGIHLIQSCHNLGVLRFTSTGPCPESPEGDSSNVNLLNSLASLPHVTNKLTLFEYGHKCPESISLIQFSNLKKLKIGDFDVYYPEGGQAQPPRVELHRLLNNVKSTLEELEIEITEKNRYRGTNEDCVVTLDIPFLMPELKRLIIRTGKSRNTNVYKVVQNMPKLEVLKVCTLSDWHGIPGYNNLFPEGRFEGVNPHLDVRKLVNMNPLQSIGEFRWMLSNFPYLKNLELSQNTISFRGSNWGRTVGKEVKLREAIAVLVEVSMGKLAELTVWAYGQSQSPEEWRAVLNCLNGLEGLKRLTIQTKFMFGVDGVSDIRKSVEGIPTCFIVEVI